MIYITLATACIAAWQIASWIIELFRWIHWRMTSEVIEADFDQSVLDRWNEVSRYCHVDIETVKTIIMTDICLKEINRDYN